MKDFLTFLRHFAHGTWTVRGLLVMLLVLVLIGAAVDVVIPRSSDRS